jgi:hypothetical protein
VSIGPLEPIVAEQLARMRRANRAVAAGEIVGRTVLIAAPADALGMRWLKRKLRHRPSGPANVGKVERPREQYVVLQVHVDVHRGFQFR